QLRSRILPDHKIVQLLGNRGQHRASVGFDPFFRSAAWHSLELPSNYKRIVYMRPALAGAFFRLHLEPGIAKSLGKLSILRVSEILIDALGDARSDSHDPRDFFFGRVHQTIDIVKCVCEQGSHAFSDMPNP